MFVTLESKHLMHFRLHGSSQRLWNSYRTGHASLKLASFCVTLHCTNYPKLLRLSLVGSQALWFSRLICNRVVAGKTTLLRQKSQQTNYSFIIAIKLEKAHIYQLMQLQQILRREIGLCCKKRLT